MSPNMFVLMFTCSIKILIVFSLIFPNILMHAVIKLCR